MSDISANAIKEFFKIISFGLRAIPWKDFIMGLAVPYLLITSYVRAGDPVPGILFAMYWCALFFVVDLAVFKWPSIFPVITFFMTSTQFAASVYASTHPSSGLFIAAIPGIDNMLLAAMFLGTLFTPRPMILYMLNRGTLERIPGKIKDSPFFLPAWKYITLAWGIAYVLQSLVVGALHVTGSPAEEVVDFVCNIPLVFLLLLFSTSFPHWYWKKKLAGS